MTDLEILLDVVTRCVAYGYGSFGGGRAVIDGSCSIEDDEAAALRRLIYAEEPRP